MTERSVLCVDDESGVLQSLKRLLRKEDYRLLVTDSPEKAFGILGEHDVHLIISDQRMPMTLGTQFLTEVKQRFPHIVRCILSGYAELDHVVSAINEGEIYRFFVKPWDDAGLKEGIRECLVHYETEEALRQDSLSLQQKAKNLSQEKRLATERALVQEAALESSRQMLDQLPTPVFALNDQGLVIFCNEYFRQQWADSMGIHLGGFVPKQVLGVVNAETKVKRTRNFVTAKGLELHLSCRKIDDGSQVLSIVTVTPVSGFMRGVQP